MTTDITTQIIIVVATLLIALSMGLFLRYLLVRRLKKTVLDNWLIQILGFLIIIPPVIVGTIVASFFFGIQLPEMLAILQYVVKDILNVQNLGNLTWNLALSILIILLAIGVGRTLMKLLNRGAAKEHIGINISTLLGRILFILVLFIAFLLILTIWNIQFGLPAAVISFITVGFTFVLQDLLKNIVVNKTIYDEKRSTIVITMPLDKYDKEQTVGCILKTIKGVIGVMLKPEPTLSLSSVAGAFGSSTGTVSGYTGEIISLTLRFWIPEGGDALVSEAMLALREALPYADLSIREPAGLL